VSTPNDWKVFKPGVTRDGRVAERIILLSRGENDQMLFGETTSGLSDQFNTLQPILRRWAEPKSRLPRSRSKWSDGCPAQLPLLVEFMPMATFDERPLVDGPLTSGVSLVLTRRPPESHVLRLGGGEIDVRQGSDALVVRTRTSGGYLDVLNRGVEVAQQGLDVMAVRRGVSLAVERTHTKHVVWWTASGQLTVRGLVVHGLQFDAPPVDLVQRRPDGSVVPQTPPQVRWHPSLRYFRLSQVTTDLIDAYRNMFLATEAILSDIRPQRSGEGESVWLKAAFNQAHTSCDLSRFFTSASADPGDDLHRDFAVDARHLVNHAKVNRGTILPLDLAHTSSLQDKLGRLGSLVQHLLERHLQIRRVSGGMFSVAFRSGIDRVAVGLQIGVTDDATEQSESDSEIRLDPASHVIWTPACPAPKYDEPSRRAFIGSWGASEFNGLSAVRRCVAKGSDDSPVSQAELSGPLTLDGVDRLEMVNGFYLTNLRMNRTDYAT
jgi:hypothetical protein